MGAANGQRSGDRAVKRQKSSEVFVWSGGTACYETQSILQRQDVR